MSALLRSVSLRRGGQFTPPQPPVGHRYHRLRFASNNGRNTLNIAEVQLRESIGGANAATGGTASASSVFSGSFPASAAFDGNAASYWSSQQVDAAAATSVFTGFPASNAFDGDPSTFWSTLNTVTAARIQLDCGSTTGADVTTYRLRARADASDGAPKDWTLEYSDSGGAWTVAHTVTNQTAWALGERRQFTCASVGPHRFWRLNVTANNGRSTLNIAELEFIGYTWGTIWLQYDQGAGKAIQVAEYTIQARADAGDGAPKSWVLEASNDGANWVTIHTVTGQTSWADGEQRVFTV